MAQLASTLVTGVVLGALLSLLAVGLVLTYRTSGIFNFALGSIAMLFAYLFFQLTQGGVVSFVWTQADQSWKLPVAVALPLVVLVIAPLVGWALDALLFRRLRTADTHVQIVSTIGLMVAIIGLVTLVWSGNTQLDPSASRIFPRGQLRIGEFQVGYARLWVIGVVILLAGTLLAFLRFTTLGVRMRAVVDRAELAELVGVDSKRVSGFSWALSSSFAALAGILAAPLVSSTLNPFQLALLVIEATAAAVVGRLASLPLVLAGALLIGVARTLTFEYGGDTLGPLLTSSVPFIVLLGALLLPVDWREVRSEVAASARAATRPTRASMPTRVTGLIFFGALLLFWPIRLDHWQFTFTTLPGVAIVFLSLVPLVGYAGQISLAHGALAGVGGVVAAHLTSAGLPFVFAVILGGLAAVVPGVLLAWRAVRLSPLFLGFATLAFAALFQQLLFNVEPITHGLTGVRFSRPALLQSDLRYYLVGLVLFGLLALLVTNLRRGKTGLALAAMRDSPTAVAGFGASTATLKLVVFSLSSFVAGVGGALIVGAPGLAEPIGFVAFISLIWLATAVVGGVNSWSGALLGGALFTLSAPVFTNSLFTDESWLGKLTNTDFYNVDALPFVLFGFAAIGLAKNPGGIVQQSRDGMEAFLSGFRRHPAPPQPDVVERQDAGPVTPAIVDLEPVPEATILAAPADETIELPAVVVSSPHEEAEVDTPFEPDRGAVATLTRSPFEPDAPPAPETTAPDVPDADTVEEPPALADVVPLDSARDEAQTEAPPPPEWTATGDEPDAGEPDEDYAVWTRAELYALAQELEIPGRSRMSRDQLIAALRAY